MASGSCAPRQQVEHMAAPTSLAKHSNSPCQRRAVHTWRRSELRRSTRSGRSSTLSGRAADLTDLTGLIQMRLPVPVDCRTTEAASYR